MQPDKSQEIQEPEEEEKQAPPTKMQLKPRTGLKFALNKGKMLKKEVFQNVIADAQEAENSEKQAISESLESESRVVVLAQDSGLLE